MTQSNETRFLKEIYSNWSIQDKVQYHHRQILFEDRMQGGYPSGYINPACTYFSKWFIDTYGAYNDNVISVLTGIAEKFNLDVSCLDEMIRYEIGSPDWNVFAEKLNFIVKS